MDTPIALREWAVAVKALEEGRQIIVLRKGGIAEETKDFKLQSPKSFLFPSFEHQRPHLVKPEESDNIRVTQAEADERPGQIRINSFAEVIEDIEVTDTETLHKLNDLHIWTEDYAEERLKWKKTKPLHVLILRVYLLEKPRFLPMQESYGGCKSWLTLEDIASSSLNPVLTDVDFERQLTEIIRRVRG